MDNFLSVVKKGLIGMTRGPVLIVAGLISGLLSAISLIQVSSAYTEAIIDNTGLFGSLFTLLIIFILPTLVTPFIVAGSYGSSLEQIAGKRGGWSRFVETGKKYYVPMLLAGICAMFIFYLLSFTLLILTSSLPPEFVLLLVLPLLFIMFVVLMYIEFYDISIVAKDVSFTKSFSESVSFVSKNLLMVVPFFLILIIAKVIPQIPVFTAMFLKIMAYIASNLTYYDNGTINMTGVNESINATAMYLQSSTFGTPSLAAIMLMNWVLQALVFAFVISYKSEFYTWVSNIKKITDFDYDFSKEP